MSFFPQEGIPLRLLPTGERRMTNKNPHRFRSGTAGGRKKSSRLPGAGSLCADFFAFCTDFYRDGDIYGGFSLFARFRIRDGYFFPAFSVYGADFPFPGSDSRFWFSLPTPEFCFLLRSSAFCSGVLLSTPEFCFLLRFCFRFRFLLFTPVSASRLPPGCRFSGFIFRIRFGAAGWETRFPPAGQTFADFLFSRGRFWLPLSSRGVRFSASGAASLQGFLFLPRGFISRFGFRFRLGFLRVLWLFPRCFFFFLRKTSCFYAGDVLQ